MSEYSIDKRNKVRRVPTRGHYDQETVYKILDDAFVCHVSFVLDGQPFIIPTLYGREGNKLYLHGATSSRMIRHLEKGVPMSLAVTHVDGIVLARSAFHHSANYRSTIVYGTAKSVSQELKEHALFIISEQVLKGRWDEVRLPNEKELKATEVLELEIEQASAKVRSGGPNDDKPDYDLDIWAGVVPMKMIYSDPIADEVLPSDIKLPPSLK
ncbi:pyridoxamine 5'-phosphate oxidase family protein [Fulvivirga sp. M361]|uniref:pyridoxamine 5'-phosphate oxidase family protein n=1 Tax=Fulvivirga sp. M361 TaxID=2594266 RepID=UPI00117B75DC|nr:pyridoxamine 5'-phosphate oxidase family protein [Fulvivirga sp. M361]TRX59386.1 pyridoxamine 5'-phosphate oxidase family protein [Fulvivirga sp. M361]